jgi:RNA polymerase sigma-70 factor (ECF subfamily)
LEGIRSNQQDAWGRMVKLYYPLVYSWCRKAGLKPEDSSDISQNVFNGVSQGIRNFTREKPADTFTGWLRTITKRRIFDFRKKTSNQPLIYEGDIHSIPDFIEEDLRFREMKQIFQSWIHTCASMQKFKRSVFFLSLLLLVSSEMYD